MLSPEQVKFREDKVTASFLPALMAGDEDRILNEWRRNVGDPAYVPENLDDSWPVQFGSYIEAFALDWHERKTGQMLTMRGEQLACPDRPFVGCTLDAYRANDDTVIDCKAPGMWRKLDDVVSYYTPQMIAQRACKGAKHAALLIVHGGSEPQEYPISWEPEYEAELWRRVDQFHHCVETLTPPVVMPSLVAVKAERVYDYGTHNQWCAEAVTWLTTRQAAKDFAACEKALKGIVPPDAARVVGAGIECKRNKAGSLSIKEVA
jgi:predicted phage-related endonuclease